MTFAFTNNALTTVAGGSGGVGTPLLSADTTLYVPTGKGALFPSSGSFMLMIGTTGLAKCTVRSTDTMTIVRGPSLPAPDGPLAADPTWPVGTTVQLVLTAAELTSPSWAGTVTAPNYLMNLGPGTGLGVVAAGDVLDTDASQNIFMKAPVSINAQIPNGTTVLRVLANGGNGVLATRAGGGAGLGLIFQAYDGSIASTPFSIGGQFGSAKSWIDNFGNAVITSLFTAQSASAPAIANNGTVTTTNVGVARVAPAGAVTGIILQAGTGAGQMCTVINESAAANSLTMAAAATSNVADGVSCVIPGLTQKTFVWDFSTSRWYHN